MVETSDGTAWANTGAGLARYDEFRWHPVAAEAGLPPFNADQLIPDLAGKIFVIVNERLYHGDANGFTPVPMLFQGDTLSVKSVAPLDASSFLVLADTLLFQFSAGQRTPIALPGDLAATPESVQQLIRTRSGTLWLDAVHGLYKWTEDGWIRWFEVSTSLLRENDTGGLLRASASPLHRSIWTWTPDSQPVFLDTGESRLVTSMDLGPTGEALALYHTGEIRYREENRWQWIEPLPAQMIGSRFVRFRQNGDLWIGTTQGLFLYRRAHRRWSRWGDDQLTQDKHINAILLTRNDDIWIGSDAGLFIHRADGSTTHLSTILDTPMLDITGLSEDRQGGIWVSSGSSFPGAFRWYQNSWQHFGPEQGLHASRIHKIIADRQGQLWFLGLSATFGGTEEDPEPGAFVYDGTQFANIGPAQGLPSGRVYAFAQSPDGAYWFGTMGGLSRWQDEQWTHWTVDQGLKMNRVFAIAVTEDGRVWFSHQHREHGLGYLDENRQPHYLTVEDGLVNNHVWSVQVGTDGALWLGTTGGLSRFADGVFSSFGLSTGLEQPQLWPVLPLEDRVYVGSVGSGVFALSLEEARNPPPVATVLQPLVDHQTTYLKWQAFAYQGELPPDHIDTRFRLDDNAWSRWGTTRETIILNLSPGPHTFTVQAKSLFGNIDPSGTTVAFRVAPPFYQHPLFLAALSLWLASMAGWGLVYWRRQQRLYTLLRQREEHFRTLIEKASDLITVLDPGGTVLYQSPSAERILGYRPEELVGKRLFEIIHPDDADLLRRMLRTIADHREPSHPLQLHVRHRRGDWKVVEVVGRMLPAENGIPSLVLNARDITERKQAEASLRQAQKLESIGTLAGGVAHEINNPINGIMNYAQLISDRLGDEDPSREFAEGIIHETQRVAVIVRNLLQFSRQEKQSHSPARMIDIVENTVSLIRTIIRRDQIMLEVDVPEDLPEIKCRSQQIQQVLMNMLINARDALNERYPEYDADKVMKVTVRLFEREGRPWLRTTVEDHGAGIPEAIRGRVFDPFFTTKDRAKGTGLGLSISHGIVQDHQGALFFESEQGHYTRFHLDLQVDNGWTLEEASDA